MPTLAGKERLTLRDSFASKPRRCVRPVTTRNRASPVEVTKSSVLAHLRPKAKQNTLLGNDTSYSLCSGRNHRIRVNDSASHHLPVCGSYSVRHRWTRQRERSARGARRRRGKCTRSATDSSSMETDAEQAETTPMLDRSISLAADVVYGPMVGGDLNKRSHGNGSMREKASVRITHCKSECTSANQY